MNTPLPIARDSTPDESCNAADSHDETPSALSNFRNQGFSALSTHDLQLILRHCGANIYRILKTRRPRLNDDAIDDIAQMSWEAVYKSLPKFRFLSTLETWLHTIVDSKISEYFRSLRAWRNNCDALGAYFGAIAPLSDADLPSSEDVVAADAISDAFLRVSRRLRAHDDTGLLYAFWESYIDYHVAATPAVASHLSTQSCKTYIMATLLLSENQYRATRDRAKRECEKELGADLLNLLFSKYRKSSAKADYRL